MLLAIDDEARLHLLIPVDAGPDGPAPADLNGLKVRHRKLDVGDVLDLSAPPSHEQVFTPFCREIILSVAQDQRDPWKAVAATTRAWQSAWKPIRPAMDKVTQVGLFGELLILKSLMIPCLGPAAVAQWSGPERERHDFIGQCVHLEVKTTRKSRPEHEISRLDQLWTPAGRDLLLASVQIEETLSGSESVATQIDEVVDLLRGHPAELDAFMTKLVNVGWSYDMRSSSDLLRCFVRAADIYAVDDDFPRLPEDLALPSGIVSVRYTVGLANLPSLGVDEVQALLRRQLAPAG